MKKCGNCGRHFEGQAFNEFTISGPYYCSYKCHCEAELIINKYEEEKRKKGEREREIKENEPSKPIGFFGKIGTFIFWVLFLIAILLTLGEII